MKTNFYKALLDQDLKDDYLKKHIRSRYAFLTLIIICHFFAVQTGFITIIIAFYAGWKFIQNEVDIRILKSIKKGKGLTTRST